MNNEGAKHVVMTEKALSDVKDIYLLVGVGIGSVGTILALIAFFKFFVTH